MSALVDRPQILSLLRLPSVLKATDLTFLLLIFKLGANFCTSATEFLGQQAPADRPVGVEGFAGAVLGEFSAAVEQRPLAVRPHDPDGPRLAQVPPPRVWTPHFQLGRRLEVRPLHRQSRRDANSQDSGNWKTRMKSFGCSEPQTNLGVNVHRATMFRKLCIS